MKAFITMREATDSHGEMIDSLEQSYCRFWAKLNVKLIPLINVLSISELSFEGVDLIILSGGGSVPNKYLLNISELRIEQLHRDVLELQLIKYALLNNIPLVGICRGMQYINCVLGGKVSDLSGLHVPGLDHQIMANDGKIHTINSFHNDGIPISNLSEDLLPIAVDKKDRNLVEAYKHRSQKVLGLQWHPERKFTDFDGYNYTYSLIKEFI